MEVGGLIEPGPAPRFDRSETDLPAAPRPVGADTLSILQELGYPAEAVQAMVAEGVVSGPGEVDGT